MVAFLWAVCQLHEPCWNDFGPGAEKIADLFRQESVWVTLRAIPAFESFLKSWGPDQHDIGEFHFKFLSWLQPRCVNLEWKRLVQEGAQVLVRDYNPPTLQAPQTAQKVGLQELIDEWSNYLGMQTTFTAHDQICLERPRSCSAQLP